MSKLAQMDGVKKLSADAAKHLLSAVRKGENAAHEAVQERERLERRQREAFSFRS